MSLDAKIADVHKQPVKITDTEAQVYTHQCRLRADGILTSARTIIQDSPALDARVGDLRTAKKLFILDSQLALPLEAQVFTTAENILVFHSLMDEHKIQALEARGVRCQQVEVKDGLLDLSQVMNTIGSLGIHDLWVEAGSQLFSTLIRERLVQKSLLYVAPKLLGAAAYPAFTEAQDIFVGSKSTQWFVLGNDAVCEIDWV
jgi:diaminohydroxyphosphoribosylaminopyrimidine deaminase/5-amino-6-(5-phosphoribosylamino)uracil reductase